MIGTVTGTLCIGRAKVDDGSNVIPREALVMPPSCSLGSVVDVHSLKGQN